ncbi:DNA-binding protein [Hoyosella altamirensis]|uniref:Uncharacterized protein n=1 Tax=Hoyosella altamirensis TaxID=616997 RepID=A0A839RRM9_9ACTN|nr:DNA-binding protein [Hoyosella altamirensis]MBB3038979.1 hypothetical protein [Hoyosella altamirensis]
MPAARIEHAVIVTGHDLNTLRYAIEVAIRARKRNGLPASPTLTRLLHLTSGHTDDRKPPGDETTPHDPIPLAAAAEQLGVSARHARRLAPRIGGRKVKGRWTVDRHALAEHLEGRT